jgi:hypothetical protein
MASLIKIAETTVSSAVSSVTLTGIDSTYDVYMVRTNNVTFDTDNVDFAVRVTTGGTPQTDANYDRATKLLRTASFLNIGSTNTTNFEIEGGGGNAANEQSNNIFYCFNFNNASEYSFCTVETSQVNLNSQLGGQQGGFVKTTAEANDGLHFFVSSGNIDTGSSFVLYGLAK